jgi:Zn-dependent M28 family amino/carboxypeptidase
MTVINLSEIAARLEEHLRMLTVTIGERSVAVPENLTKTADYIISFHEQLGLLSQSEFYAFGDFPVANVSTRIEPSANPSACYLVGAHYDSVEGTVGADDNASAIAVQLETARQVKLLAERGILNASVKFVSFALEEPPAFETASMGSRIYARKARREREKIDGMICLEMVGYSCRRPGCQGYPFPLMFMKYPKIGDFIGIVGNMRSTGLTASLKRAFQKNSNLPVVTLTVPMNGWPLPSVRRSDHASFWDHGFKAVMITDTAFYRNPNYHLASDTMEKLDYNYMAELVKSLVLFFSAHE